MTKTTKNESAPARFTTYKLIRTSLTERQICEVTIEGDKVVSVKAHEPDLGRIVMSKFFSKLWGDDDKALQAKETT